MLTLPNAFISGVIAMGHAVAALFFLRFFVRTRDRLFVAFAGAFALLSLNAGLVIVLQVPQEEQSPFYLLRLCAFLLIIVAVLAKNLGRKSR